MATITPLLRQTPPKVSIDEYLDREWAAEQAGGRNAEYVNGEVREMPGADWRHNVVAGSLGTAIGPRLRGKAFAVCGSQMRICVSESGPYYYPDLSVSPVPPAVRRDRGDSLLNPVVVFEVTSPSTEGTDRGEKLDNYGRIASVEDYVVVAPDEIRVHHFSRQKDGSWRLVISTELDGVIELASFGVEIPLGEIYAYVFPAGPEG